MSDALLQARQRGRHLRPTGSRGSPCRLAWQWAALAGLCLASLLASTSAASATAASDDICHTAAPAAVSAEAGTLVRSTPDVVVPAVRLRRQDGATVDLAASLDDERPVLLNFIFTSCTTICPPMAQTFAATQERLGARRDQVQMISISIDPAHDHPARLREYAARFEAGKQWRFHTGSQQAVDAVQRAFNVYRPDKMGHTPVTFVRVRGSRQWVRLDGYASPDRLIREAYAAPR